MKKRLYQSPELELKEIFINGYDAIMSSGGKVVDPIGNGGSYGGEDYA